MLKYPVTTVIFVRLFFYKKNWTNTLLPPREKINLKNCENLYSLPTFQQEMKRRWQEKQEISLTVLNYNPGGKNTFTSLDWHPLLSYRKTVSSSWLVPLEKPSIFVSIWIEPLLSRPRYTSGLRSLISVQYWSFLLDLLSVENIFYKIKNINELKFAYETLQTIGYKYLKLK